MEGQPEHGSKMWTKAAGLALVSIMATGCIDSFEPDPVVEEATGELGHGMFRWDCVDASDPTCGTGVFPTVVALGSRFDLAFIGSVELPDDLGSSELEPVSPSRLSTDAGDHVALRPGDVSVVSMAGGYAVDFVSLRIVPVDELILGEYESADPGPCDDIDSDGVCDGTGGVVHDAPVELVVGESIDVRARALGDWSDLAGALPYSWESLTPELVGVTRASGRSAELEVYGKGTAQLLVRAGDFEKIFEYEVQDPPPEPPDETTGGETDGSGSGSDSDSGSDSGSDTGSGSDAGSSSGTGDPTTGGETDGATTTGGV